MYDAEEREQEKDSFNIYKFAGTVSGFFCLVSLSAFFAVFSRIFPVFLGGVFFVQALAFVAGLFVTVRANNLFVRFCAGIGAIAVMGGAVAGWHDGIIALLGAITVGKFSGLTVAAIVGLVFLAFAIDKLFQAKRGAE